MLRQPELDKKIESTADVGRTVRALPEESVSMAWRSQLNERLIAEAAKTRPRTPRWFWLPATGLGLATTLAVALLVRGNLDPVAAPGVEAELVRMHQVAAEAPEVLGAGLTAVESTQRTPETVPTFDSWNEVDLESL